MLRGVLSRAAKLASRSYRHAVLLVARGSNGRLAGTSTVELRLDVLLSEGKAWRAVLDDARDTLAVGLPRAVNNGGQYACCAASVAG